MKKGKRNGFLRILVMLLVFAMMIIGCNEESTDTGFKSIVKDGSGNTYTLAMNSPSVNGTKYVLNIQMTDGTEKTSRGIINKSSIEGFKLNLQLQPSVEDSSAFKVTLTLNTAYGYKWGDISSIDGEIAVEGGDTLNSPGSTSVIIPSVSKFKDVSGNIYTLTMNEVVKDMYQELEGTDYVLTIQMTYETVETSKGIINGSAIFGGWLTLTLQPSVENSNTFNITLSDRWDISSIDGEIAVEGGYTVKPPSIQLTTAKTPDKTTAKAKNTSVYEKSDKIILWVFILMLIFGGGGVGVKSSLSRSSKSNNNDDDRRREEDYQRRVAEARREAERNGDSQRKFVGY